jgi:putative tricarboxylic transport membrane protein
MTRLALRFGPPEYFSLMILGLIILNYLIYLTQKSLSKAISMGALGLILSYVGTDMVSGQMRYTVDLDWLLDGIGTVLIVMGIFGVREIFENLERTGIRSLYQTHIKGLLPSLKDWSESIC